MLELSSKSVEMSASVEASELIHVIAGDQPAGARLEPIWWGLAAKLKMPFRRVKAIWYREARLISSDEMDALRKAARQRRGEAEGDFKRRFDELHQRMERLERLLADRPSRSRLSRVA